MTRQPDDQMTKFNLSNLSHLPHLDHALSTLVGSVGPDVARILDKALGGGEVTVDEGTRLFGAIRSACSIEEYLRGLKDAGVGSLPGTSAEIFDQKVREKIAPGRITSAQWREVITTAHTLGIPTTSTIMFGHIETNAHRAA